MQRVLVTGAGGFVGGWVVEAFQQAGLPVRAGIRSWNSAIRLARRGTEIVPCDVLQPAQIAAAMDGCGAVVHCAVGGTAVTIDGTRHVLQAAQQQGLGRIVHLSSVAVYGKAPGTIDEQHPRRSGGNPYARDKLAAEEVCESFLDQGAPVIGLRPSIIYGPFSEAWTISFAKRLVSGRWGTFGNWAEGTCNLVYVTDVVQAVFRALEADAPRFGFYNVNGPELICWNEYFRRFNAALGRAPLPERNAWPIAAKAQLLAPVRSAARYALGKFGGTLTKLHAQSAWAAKTMSATESSLKLTPTREQLKLYGIEVEYLIDKAREQLRYEPQVSVQAGLEASVNWLDQQGVLY